MFGSVGGFFVIFGTGCLIVTRRKISQIATEQKEYPMDITKPDLNDYDKELEMKQDIKSLDKPSHAPDIVKSDGELASMNPIKQSVHSKV